MTGTDHQEGYSTQRADTVTALLTLVTTFIDDAEVEANEPLPDNKNGFIITDTIAAIVSAILALVFLIMVICLIQVIKKRRQERQGRRLNQQLVRMIAPQTFGANIEAYRHFPVSNAFTWETVASDQPSTLRMDEVEEGSEDTTSDIYSASASVLVTAILHPPPTSDELAGIDNPLASSLTLEAVSIQTPTHSLDHTV